mgnify:CR=1 FL=1
MASGFYCRWSPIRFSVWLIFNMILQLWADVKYHIPTGVGFSPSAKNQSKEIRLPESANKNRIIT